MIPATNYTNRIENNAGSQQILNENKDKINSQCSLVLQALLRGEKLTVVSAILKYGIGDLRRRCKDLKDYHHIKIDENKLPGGFKEWFMSDDTIFMNRNKLFVG